VLVGGSPVSEGIIPAEFAGVRWDGSELRNGYAVGLPGGTTSEFFHAVKLACPTPPKLLVYGITASDLNDARHEPHGPASLMTFGDVFDWAVSRTDSREWVVRQYAVARVSRAWSLFRHRHGVRMWAALQADAISPGCCPEAVKEARELRDYADALRAGDGYAPAAGFVTRAYNYSKANSIPTPPFTFLDKYRTGSHLTCLHRLIDWCESRGTALVLVDMPVTADLEAKYPAAFVAYRALLADIEQSRGLTVIRAHRGAVGLTDAGFADLIHLNGVGAKLLSRWLRDRLDDIGRPTELRDDRVRAQAGGDRP
jgi:hypothetical protein